MFCIQGGTKVVVAAKGCASIKRRFLWGSLKGIIGFCFVRYGSGIEIILLVELMENRRVLLSLVMNT